jgi:hypothetical protein
MSSVNLSDGFNFGSHPSNTATAFHDAQIKLPTPQNFPKMFLGSMKDRLFRPSHMVTILV